MDEILDFLENALNIQQLDPVNYQYFNNLLKHRTIIFNTCVDEQILERVVLPLREFENDDSEEPVTLIINTPGGSLFSGMTLCNIIDHYKKKLNIIVYGYSMSMGTIILCAGNHNPNVTKYCYEFSIFLHHLGDLSLEGETGSVKDTVVFTDELNEKINKYILDNTNISEELLNKNIRKQWYFGANEAKEYGLIDKIIGCDE